MSDSLTLEMVKYRVHQRRYSQWRAIIAETGESDTNFLRGLAHLHGIAIDKAADPVVFMTEDTQQKRLLLDEGVPSPTMLQLMLTARVFSLSEDDIPEKFQAALLKANPQWQP